MKNIILASKSPRRKELLEKLGLKFEVEESGFDENSVDQTKFKPLELAKFLSLQKAKTTAKKHKEAIIIAADTFVVVDGEIFGKPKDKKEALKKLNKLKGRMHLVITGFTILDSKSNKISTKAVVTKVYFRKLSKKEINAYVESGEPMDKAGAYAVQEKGSDFVEKIEGDFFNVVGLPIYALTEELKKFGVIPQLSSCPRYKILSCLL